jgi:ribosomal-protein-alanine N-acetyltransferase
MKQSNRLVFDMPHQTDFKRFYEINSDPQTNLFNPKGPMNFESAEDAFNNFLKHWHTHNFGSWRIRLKDSDTTIGFGGISYRLYGDELKLNLGYRFDKDYWGHGYATELAEYAIDYGFQELKVAEIFALVRPKHAASIKILEKCNMRLFGTLDDVPGEEQSLVYVISGRILKT